ncbi:response regulator [Pelagicoccus sp. SDUM812005]|uniref:response regulator n=1 Tax=Pelagicoccus sp. SDUM812005 TaxID=3041257 RepID=UPI002810097B|nr:response regulator [Pelagicoccus sp. SDUM812005]MDQ8179254.1 response regulator [Pelagicoccus sp. SDUM812005]
MQKTKSRPSKHRVVVVEDDNTSRKLIARILEQAGYDVLECAHGKDALHIAEMNPPRAMIVDVMLPDTKGTKIVQELTYNKDCRFTKYLFLTGILSKRSEKSNYFFEIDGERYRALPKPIRKGQLLRHLAEAVIHSLEMEDSERREREAEKLPPSASPSKNSSGENGEIPDDQVILSEGLY